MGARRVVVTRPVREAERWVADLQARSIDAVALPLMAIEPLHDTRALDAARGGAAQFDALMFVSAAAVAHFFAAGGIAVGDHARFWATGPGTAAALLAAGVPAEAIDSPPPASAQFDSEHLWSLVHAQVGRGKRVLVVRGGNLAGQPSGRPWLAREVEAAGAALDEVAAYRRVRPTWDAAQRALATSAAKEGAIWLFTSGEAVRHLVELLPDVGWRSARALATHPRIAQAARDARFGVVQTTQPGLDALVASIESIA